MGQHLGTNDGRLDLALNFRPLDRRMAFLETSQPVKADQHLENLEQSSPHRHTPSSHEAHLQWSP